MAVMDPPNRRDLVSTLEKWLERARAGLQCATPPMPPGIIALIVTGNDEPPEEE